MHANLKRRVVIADKLCKKLGQDIKANKQWYEPVGKNLEMASTVTAWLYANNPMRDRVFRNTRDTLRAYRDAGVWPVAATIPNRVVEDRSVEMSKQEQDLYCEVQNYIRTKYDQAEHITSGQVKNALGFILTVYRRRLTSSFYAIERSLRRRISALDGNLGIKALLSPDDTILEEDPDIVAEVAAWALDDEIASLRSLADKIAVISNQDETKMLLLHKIVSEALNGGHQTVLIFTQYADTMTYVRNRLDAIWHGRVIGYSAGGGKIRDEVSAEWVSLSKRQTKELFRAGERVKILVGTDTLSEGLNLQTCDRLVNYDLPWNFTRVEQRIGRIDRIQTQQPEHPGEDENADRVVNKDNPFFFPIKPLKTLSVSRKKNVIRYWIEQCGLSLPSTAHLEQIDTQLLQGRIDANPLVQWPGGNIRRYRDHLYAEPTHKTIDLQKIILTWDLSQPLTLPASLGILTAQQVNGHGFSSETLKRAPLTIRFRQGGERCQPVGRAHSQVLKKLWQEYGIPTWERKQIPLLYCGEELAGVIGHWVCAPFAAEKDEKGWVINKELQL